jgi:mRNA-degrading endonuclease YafQ of YafQ-DinJ toxin-antitoxin module
LSENPFQPQLKTHKLKGKFGDSFSCNVGYDLRIVFSFSQIEGKEVILLESFGTHDEVY